MLTGIKRSGVFISALNYKVYLLSILAFSIAMTPFIGFSQNEIKFQVFGETPNIINDTLYQALNKATKPTKKFKLLYQLGNEHLTFGNADSALYYAHQLKEINKLDTSTSLITPLLLLGNAKLLKGLHNDALTAFIKALELSETSSNPFEKAWLKIGLAKLYINKNELNKAKATLRALESNSNDTIVANTLFYSAEMAIIENNFTEAIDYLEKASEQIVEKELPKFKMQIQLSLAQIAAKKKEYDRALGIYEYLVQYALNYNYYDIYTESVLGYGEINRELKNFEPAEMTLAMAYSNSIQWNRLELQKKIINSLRLTYQEKGDYENAYNLMTQYVSISNQIIRQQNNEAVKELEVKYQTLQKENEIFELKEVQLAKQSEIDRQKTIKKAFLYGFLALLIPIIALLFVYYQKLQAQSQVNVQQEQLNAQKITALLNEQELSLAKTSLEAQQEERTRIAKQLHDSIGGNLAGIKLQLSHLQDEKLEKQGLIIQINETYELVREISHNLTPKKFNENNFTHIIAQYLNQLSDNSNLAIIFSAHPKEKINAIKKELKVEIYQIIQELLANTIKHARAKNLEVHLNLFKKTFQLIFEDDGIGFNAASTPKGIGLKNLKNRAQNLKGTMNIDTALNRGTVITLEFPLNTKKDENI